MPILISLGRYILFIRRIFSKPEKHGIYFRQVFREIDKPGVSSLGIVAIISFFIGLIGGWVVAIAGHLYGIRFKYDSCKSFTRLSNRMLNDFVFASELMKKFK